jgi:hypothetical protein
MHREISHADHAFGQESRGALARNLGSVAA